MRVNSGLLHLLKEAIRTNNTLATQAITCEPCTKLSPRQHLAAWIRIIAPWKPDNQAWFALYSAIIVLVALICWATSNAQGVTGALQVAAYLWGICLAYHGALAIVLVIGLARNGRGSLRSQLAQEYVEQATKPMLVHLLRPYRERRHDRRMARHFNNLPH